MLTSGLARLSLTNLREFCANSAPHRRLLFRRPVLADAGQGIPGVRRIGDGVAASPGTFRSLSFARQCEVCPGEALPPRRCQTAAGGILARACFAAIRS